MKKISVDYRRAPGVATVARLALLGALAGPGFSVAQISACQDYRPELRNIKTACTDFHDPFEYVTRPDLNHPGGSDLTVTPQHPLSRDSDSQMVTLQQLEHVVPKRAQKEMVSADKAIQRDNAEEAISHLKTAIQIDPGFVRARNDLAVVYIRMGNPDPAIEQLTEAIKVDPHSPLLFTNLAVSYIISRKLNDGERAARTAVDLDRTGVRPRYILALALHYEKQFSEEALEYAERTSSEYPVAHLFAARIFLARHEFQRAKQEIQAYLSGPVLVPEFEHTINGWLSFISENEQRAGAILP